jgi:deferrochelatase/peroxidase EfeB
VFAAFDLTAGTAAGLRGLLAAWSSAADRLMAGNRSARDVAEGRRDTGEAHDLPPARLTLTFGLGSTLFERDGADRYGLRARRPVALRPLPPFPGDALDPRRCDGDLAVQVCADDAQVAFHALHTLVRVGDRAVAARWAQTGFLSRRAEGAASPRDLFGFRDGTLNPRSPQSLDAHVWVGTGDRTWMRGGTYLVARRIRVRLDSWHATPVEQQERVIGRHKVSGAPLGERSEYDLRRLDARRDGEPVIPADAHVRLAAPETNQGVRLLRRGYNYFDGVDPADGRLDAGLLFLSFQQDPRRQFVPLQRRLAESDALSQHLAHTGSAVFAIPPAPAPGEFLGQRLFD